MEIEEQNEAVARGISGLQATAKKSSASATKIKAIEVLTKAIIVARKVAVQKSLVSLQKHHAILLCAMRVH